MKAPNKKKFDCKDIEKLLHAFLDDQLGSEEKNLFEEHLDFCLPCDKKVEFEHKLKRFIQDRAKENTYPASLEKDLLRVINEGHTNS
jgi:mycothiol system anti-sigma-R factor